MKWNQEICFVIKSIDQIKMIRQESFNFHYINILIQMYKNVWNRKFCRIGSDDYTNLDENHLKFWQAPLGLNHLNPPDLATNFDRDFPLNTSR